MGRRGYLLGLVLLCSAGCGDECDTSADCSDGTFCNGEEVCFAGSCGRLPAPDCDDEVACTIDSCNEEFRTCLNEAPDADGDGSEDATCVGADGRVLGDDCDDGDANRFPGNVEVCDGADHDEDCDPFTFGSVDLDEDGYDSAGCCNQSDDGLICGNDCDDTLASVFPGMQVCDSARGVIAVDICTVDGLWQEDVCANQGTCVEQPNGLGVCVP